MQNADCYADYTHLSPKNLYVWAHSGKITLAYSLSGKSLFVLLLVRAQGKKWGVNYTAAGLFEVPEAREKETSTPFNTKVNAPSSTAKPPVFGVHLDNVAADTVKALLAVTRLWGGRAGSQAAQRNAHSPTRAWMRGKPDGRETDKQEEDGRSQSRASPPTCLPHLTLQTSPGIPMICMWWMAPSTPHSFCRGAGQPAPKYATMAYCFWN